MSKTKMLSYWDYLSLDVILNAQYPKTDAHDEPLFIMIHQTFEVWFKLLIFELRETIKQLHAGDAAKAAHYLHRVNTILGISAHGFHVMDTMTPEAFREFRDALIPASGTQSFQFRELEILAGVEKIKDAQGNEKFYWEDTPDAGLTLKYFFEKYGTRLRDVIEEAKRTGTLRSLFTALLTRTTGENDLVKAAAKATGDVKTLLDEVKSFDETFIHWRSAHVSTTAHAISDSPGTVLNEHEQLPTSSCVDYLQSTIDFHKQLLFPEFHQK
jgi:tryptophan 2,3-dioxygenase